LASLTNGRADTIRKAVEHAAEHVKFNDCLLTQLTQLDHIARENGMASTMVARGVAGAQPTARVADRIGHNT